MAETNAGRLKRIKQRGYSPYDHRGDCSVILTEDIKWLIEQAERAQELEVENARLKDDWKGTQEVLRKSIKISDVFEVENKRLREALEKIMDYGNRGRIVSSVDSVVSAIARRALEGKGNE